MLTGATGFLGKVLLEMVLRRHPDLARIYLLARGKGGRSAAERLEAEVLPSPAFGPLKAQLGEVGFLKLWREKVVAVQGDSSDAMFGFDAATLAELKSTDVVIHCAGLTDFNPALDEACRSNAYGALRAIELAQALGAGLVHVSTCYVTGSRDGLVPEDEDPVGFCPRGKKEGGLIFDADRELADLARFIARAEEDANDQEHQSVFQARAIERLKSLGRHAGVPDALAAEVANQQRRHVANALRDEGGRRARHWGWPNTYTYTKSLGEQLVAWRMRPGKDAIVRPAIIECSLTEPFAGWNEGINTCAPLTYLAWKGHRFYPTGEKTRIDLVPVDFVANGLLQVAAVSIRGEARPIYQLGTSEVNPISVRRVIELMDLANREQYRKRRGWESMMLMNLETVAVSKESYDTFSAPGVREAARLLTKVLDGLPVRSMGPLGLLAVSAKKTLKDVERFTDRTDRMVQLFLPFLHDHDYRFVSRNALALRDRMPADERAWAYSPDEIDWRAYMLKAQIPGLHKWIFPELERKLGASEEKPLTGPADLLELLDAAVAAHGERTAFKRLIPGSVERVTYAEFGARVAATAVALGQMGVVKGDRVALVAENRPEWAIAYFGILRSGATVAPMDAQASVERVRGICAAHDVRTVVLSEKVKARLGINEKEVRLVSLEDVTRHVDGRVDPRVKLGDGQHAPAPDSAASLIATSGTTGNPKGVLLSHKNFTSQVAGMQRVFDLTPKDTLLSVLPLHHTFEFTCGLLLPLSRGATVTYIDEVNGEQLSRALREERITALIGVPALWQLLHRKVRAQADARGEKFAKGFDKALEMSALLRDRAHINLGPLVFSQVHRALGGNLRYLVSGGAALPKETFDFYRGLGLKLFEGYGLTEAAPVLAVGRPGLRQEAGTVGKALPGVELKIQAPDENGVGEVVARGPNIMLGYASDPEATAQVLKDGWLYTGDLGKLDAQGRLTLVGRDKDVIVESSGKNVYPDEVEELYGNAPYVKELCVAGAPDGAGGERVAALVVPDYELAKASDLDRAGAQAAIAEHFRGVSAKVPTWQKVKLLRFWDKELPRTPTRKVKRNAVKVELARIVKIEDATRGAGAGASSESWLTLVLAQLSGRPASEISGATRLVEDLGFDSLMTVELMAAIEQRTGRALTQEEIARTESVAALEAQVGRSIVPGGGASPASLGGRGGRVPLSESDGRSEPGGRRPTALPAGGGGRVPHSNDPEIPLPIRKAVMGFMGRAQKALYDRAFDVEVLGRGNIPHNRQTLVVANHTSHLDMGLVKHALRDYAPNLAALAAQDYFFDNKLRRLYFKNFTNLVPMDRAGAEEAMRTASDRIRRGDIVLLFPEGTRSADGVLGEFRRGLGWLVMKNKIDVLPLYLEGTHRALPRGSAIPKARNLAVHIGPPIPYRFLVEHTAGKPRRHMYEEVSAFTRDAVLALKERRQARWSLPAPTEVPEPKRNGNDLSALFDELCGRFVPGKSARKLAYYFTLGPAEGEKWTVRVDERGAHFHAGKPTNADCVVKTNAAVLRRIVREGQMPTLEDFASGVVKTSDGDLLASFQQIFGL